LKTWNDWQVCVRKNFLELDRLGKIETALFTRQELVTGVGALPFYCGVHPESNCCFTHKIGLPKHPDTLVPTPIAPYQLEFIDTISNTNHREFHVNKSRQIGFTEIMLRILQYRGFNKYKGKLNIIIAGTREKTTKHIFGRFVALYDNIPQEIERKEGNLGLRLRDGTEFIGLPASPEAITGLTKIGAIFVDEAAKFNLIDDQPVMNAVKPIVDINRSDLFLISTPKGRRGFFYNIDIEENSFLKLKYNIWHGVPWIYTKERAEEMLKDPTVDGEQEYLNQYTTSRSSIFGSDYTEEEYEAEVY